MPVRCDWCDANEPLYLAYHDNEWGVPSYDERHLFELLTLEGAQAGLRWITILKKRDNYRRLFADFDASVVATYGHGDVERLLGDPGIIRQRLKIEAVISNARALLELQQQHGSFSAFLWRYVDGVTLQNSWRERSELPAHTRLSALMSKDLKKFGFKFVGPTICYSLMQAAGLVNDHVVGCFRHAQIKELASHSATRHQPLTVQD